MRSDLSNPPSTSPTAASAASVRLYDDESLVLVGLGSFGERVLRILVRELARLRIPEERVLVLGVDCGSSTQGAVSRRSSATGDWILAGSGLAVSDAFGESGILGESSVLARSGIREGGRATPGGGAPGGSSSPTPDGELFLRLPSFDGALYVRSPENASLRAAVSHVPPEVLRGLAEGRRDIPALGLVAFHRYDETLVTQRLLSRIDEARAKNPSGKIKCLVVCSLDEGFGGGMLVPLLLRVRNHLKHRKVELEVFLATGDGQEHDAGGEAALEPPASEQVHRQAQLEGWWANPQRLQRERNCVAAAMLWEQIQLGERAILYPGKEGVREDCSYRGPSAQRTWFFSRGPSAGAATSNTTLASVVASCIAALETTHLGAHLDRDRVHYTEDILERTWTGEKGGRHPTTLLAMNVGGLKLDCLPALVQLRAARGFLDEMTQAVAERQSEAIGDAAADCLMETGIADESISRTLRIGNDPLTAQELREAQLPQDKLYAYIEARFAEHLGTLFAMADGTKWPLGTDALIEQAQRALRTRAQAIANSPGAYLPGAILFYQSAARHIEALRRRAAERRDRARGELAGSVERSRLEALLERLKRDTVWEEGQRPGVFERFVATVTVSVQTQVRKILEVARGMQDLAVECASSSVIVQVYDTLLRTCERERAVLQSRAYALNHATSLCLREEEHIQRDSRSAFTYQKARFEPLVAHLCDRLADKLPAPETSAVLARLGADLAALASDEDKAFHRVLEAVRPDLTQFASATDELMASAPLVREALEESLAQFFVTTQVDRERFPTLATARSRFVLCTRRVYEAHRADLLADCHHLETDNPYNVLVTDHEEGIPFVALSDVYRMHVAYKIQRAQEGTLLAHSQARFADELPLLDE